MASVQRSSSGSAARAALAAALVVAAVLAGCSTPESVPPFVDITGDGGFEFVHFNGMSGELYMSENLGTGSALFDYDGDGDLDIYLGQGHILGPGKTEADATFPPQEAPRHRLFRNDLVAGADRRLRHRWIDATNRSRLEARGYGMGAAVGDIDNDGDFDLYVMNHSSDELWRNAGDGTFTPPTAGSATDDPRWSTSASFLDFDTDGWLDLFVVNYVDYQPGSGSPCRRPSGQLEYCGPQSFDPEVSRLLHNRGGGDFEDVTLESGIFRSPGSGLGVVAADFDGDRRTDIYVANDQMPNRLWMNRGDGTFGEEALERGAALGLTGRALAGMGVDAGDVDGDDDDDLFVTNLKTETHTLYLNDGRGFFVDGTAASGLAAPSFPYTGFGTAMLDFDLDGDLDILTVNGEVRTIPEQVAAGDPHPLRQAKQLFVNDGRGRFVELLPRPAPLAVPEVSRSLSVGDLEGDGDPDLLVGNNGGPARLLAATVTGRRWIGVVLAEPGAAAGGPGTIGHLRTDSTTLRRRVRVDGSYGAAQDPRLLFGLGASGRAAALELRWPDGRRIRLLAPPNNRYLRFVGPGSSHVAA